MAGVVDVRATYQGSKKANPKAVVMYIAAWTIVAGLITLLLVSIFGISSEEDVPLKLDTQLTYLGFVVALAAYLATVAQSLKSRITDLKEEDPPKKNTGAKILKHQRDLNLVVWAEVLIVWLGFLMTMRLVFGPLSRPNVPLLTIVQTKNLDYFYLIFLGLGLLNLVFLHLRQWTHES